MYTVDPMTITSEVETLAGDGREGNQDSESNKAAFSYPGGVAVLGGTIYIADTQNHKIRRLDEDGTLSTVAGSGGAGFVDGPADAAMFFSPVGVAVGPDGIVYVADSGNNAIRQLFNGAVYTLCHGKGYAAADQRVGVEGGAPGDFPWSIAAAASRRLGEGAAGAKGEGEAAAPLPPRRRASHLGRAPTGYLPSGLAYPTGLAVWPDSTNQITSLIVADKDNHRLVRCLPAEFANGERQWPAPPPPPPPVCACADGSMACECFPPPPPSAPPELTNSTADEEGEGDEEGGGGRRERMLRESIEKPTNIVYPPDGRWALELFAGGSEAGHNDGEAMRATFRRPHHIALCIQKDLTIRVFVADEGNHAIRMLRQMPMPENPNGANVSTLAGTTGTPGTEDSMTKREKPKASVLLTSQLPSRFALPQGVACDSGMGGVVVADTSNHRIRQVNSEGVTVTIAGLYSGYFDGKDKEAEFNFPTAVARDGQGRFVVIDRGNHAVRRVTMSGASLDSAAPSARGASGAGAWLAAALAAASVERWRRR